MDVQGIVNILNGSGYSIGTGFFTSSNGYILTCYHVLKLIDSIGLNSPISFKFVASETVHFAVLIAVDKEKDIAILHSDLKPMVYYRLKVGGQKNEQLSTLGFPNGEKIGIPAEPIFQSYIENGKYIQLKEAEIITHGFSGGPLITEDGFAIGMIAWNFGDNFRLKKIAYGIPSKEIIDSFGGYLDIKSDGKDNIYDKVANEIHDNESRDNKKNNDSLYIKNNQAKNLQVIQNAEIHGGIHFG